MGKMNIRKFCFLLCLLAGTSEAVTYTVKVGQGQVKVEWYADGVVRVVKTPTEVEYARKSLAVTAAPKDVKVKVKETQDTLFLSDSRIQIAVAKLSGEIVYRMAKRAEIVREASGAVFTSVDDAGHKSWKVKQGFRLEKDEAIYGLGILQNGKMSQRGVNRELRPGNTEDGVSFFQSEKGYGIYWDNYSPTNISDKGTEVAFSSEVGDAVDYYFIYGGNADGVVSGVRELTGDVPMLPLWSYGFMQSRERYKSQQELLDVLHRYRKDGIPIDCMIQDWQYWGNNYLWNAMEFMSESFPNPKAMINEVHAQNAKCMICIWSSFGPMTKPYRQLDEKGLLFNMQTWPQSGISHQWPPRQDYPSGVRVYNCYSPEARDIYWKNLKRIYDLGMDGWWMDSTEPDHFDWQPADFDRQTGMGSYRSVLCAFPLMTVGGVYDHQRAESDSSRVFILTRSCTFGQQRYGANVWSGDVVSTWDMLRKQVPAGLNFSLTGNPNFNSDLGGFFAGSYNRSWKGKPAYENPAYHELYARWTQQGVFTPMMRSHGADVPRELYYYGKPGEPVYDALLGAIKLRYRLLPYIYSTSWSVSKRRDTFMRALVMDFPADAKAKSLNDEYMFGRAILATPILNAQYTPEVVRHDADANAGWDKNTGKIKMDAMENVDFSHPSGHTVYLPAGSRWYYFHNNKVYDGGQDVKLEIPFTEIPFFIRGGSILPIGPDVQYSGEKAWDNLEIRVYPGANAEFTLYEDRGDGYDYEQGKYSEIPMTWNNRTRTLTIHNRRGSYRGMTAKKTFRVTLPDGKQKTVNYNGKKIAIKL